MFLNNMMGFGVPFKEMFPRRPAPDHHKAARDYLSRGKTQFSALTGAGYSRKQARKGFVATLKSSGPLRQAVKNELIRWHKVAEILPSPHDRANLVRVRLLLNVLSGKDAAAQSAKLLGQDKEVAMWEPETRTGINIAVAPPAEWRKRYFLEEPETRAENPSAESPEVRHLTRKR